MVGGDRCNCFYLVAVHPATGHSFRNAGTILQLWQVVGYFAPFFAYGFLGGLGCLLFVCGWGSFVGEVI